MLAVAQNVEGSFEAEILSWRDMMGKIAWISKLLDKAYAIAPAVNRFFVSLYELWGKIRKGIGK